MTWSPRVKPVTWTRRALGKQEERQRKAPYPVLELSGESCDRSKMHNTTPSKLAAPAEDLDLGQCGDSELSITPAQRPDVPSLGPTLQKERINSC